jgi:hypothetical protein
VHRQHWDAAVLRGFSFATMSPDSLLSRQFGHLDVQLSMVRVFACVSRLTFELHCTEDGGNSAIKYAEEDQELYGSIYGINGVSLLKF